MSRLEVGARAFFVSASIVSGIVAVGSLSGCGICPPFVSCGDTGSPPAQDGTTRAIFNGISGSWSQSNIVGYVDTPRFPVSIDQTHTDRSYSAIITGNQIGSFPYPDPNKPFVVKTFGYLGPHSPNNPNGPFDSWYSPNSSSTIWTNDPRYPNQQSTYPFGFWTVGLDGAGSADTAHKDKMFAQAELKTASSAFKVLGLAELTWKFNTQGHLMIGSKAQVFVNEGLWIQATADLPEPVSYSWTVNDEPRSWSGSFAYVIFSDNGNKAISALMTGANNVQVQATWNVWVKCLPPASPYADDCNMPPE